MVTIPDEEYAELKKKAAAYDKIKNNNSKAGKASVAKLSPEERSARAKKAVEAKILKYGLNKRK